MCCCALQVVQFGELGVTTFTILFQKELGFQKKNQIKLSIEGTYNDCFPKSVIPKWANPNSVGPLSQRLAINKS